MPVGVLILYATNFFNALSAFDTDGFYMPHFLEAPLLIHLVEESEVEPGAAPLRV